MKVWPAVLIVWPVALAVFAIFMALESPTKAGAQVPWPTPPPAPVGLFPQVIPASQIKPVPAPATPGSIALQVDPIFAGAVPRVPPRASTTIVTGETSEYEKVTLQIDAGALDQTLQLTYEPVAPGKVPQTGPARQARRAFWIRTYDYAGSAVTPTFRYPVRLILTVSADELAASGNDPARLLLAWFDPAGNRWLPLVATYRVADNSLLVRVLHPGLFVLMTEPSPATP